MAIEFISDSASPTRGVIEDTGMPERRINSSPKFYEAKILHHNGISETWYIGHVSKVTTQTGLMETTHIWLDGDAYPPEVIRSVSDFKDATEIVPWTGYQGEPQTRVTFQHQRIRPVLVVSVEEKPLRARIRDFLCSMLPTIDTVQVEEVDFEWSQVYNEDQVKV